MKSAGTSNLVVDAIYAYLSVGTNIYGTVKLAQKPAKKGQARKNIAYTFRTDRTSGKVGIGTPALPRGTAIDVVFFASNNLGVLYHTNKLTVNNIK